MASESGVRTRTENLSRIILQVDPDFRKANRKTTVYEFGDGRNKRKFVQNPDVTGIYTPEE